MTAPWQQTWLITPQWSEMSFDLMLSGSLGYFLPFCPHTHWLHSWKFTGKQIILFFKCVTWIRTQTFRYIEVCLWLFSSARQMPGERPLGNKEPAKSRSASGKRGRISDMCWWRDILVDFVDPDWTAHGLEISGHILSSQLTCVSVRINRNVFEKKS